jgi:hypothetical protein
LKTCQTKPVEEETQTLWNKLYRRSQKQTYIVVHSHVNNLYKACMCNIRNGPCKWDMYVAHISGI